MNKDSRIVFRASTSEKRMLRDLARRHNTTISGVLRSLVTTAAGAGQAPQTGTGK